MNSINIVWTLIIGIISIERLLKIYILVDIAGCRKMQIAEMRAEQSPATLCRCRLCATCTCHRLERQVDPINYEYAERQRRSEGIWLSGKTLDCRPSDCEFDPPTPTKTAKMEICTSTSQEKRSKKVPVYQCFTLGTLKNQVCHVWWALQYLALWATNRN